MPATKATKATTVIPGLPGAPFGETGSPGITVPAKRHLVVETLSVQVDVTPPGTKVEAFVNYTCGGKKVQLFVPLTYAYTEPSTNFDFHVALQAVRLYVDPNIDHLRGGLCSGWLTGNAVPDCIGILDLTAGDGSRCWSGSNHRRRIPTQPTKVDGAARPLSPRSKSTTLTMVE